MPHGLQYIGRANSQGGRIEKMGSRGQITELLNQLEHDLKTLEIAYEKYFLGTEKRAPEKERQKITLRMRKMITHYIPQTDLRFKLQSITSRFNSYCGYWDRIQRLIDEGRYERHTARILALKALSRRQIRFQQINPATPWTTSTMSW